MTAVEAAAAPIAPALASGGLYDHLSSAERYIHRTRDETLLAVLRRHGHASLAGRRVLEVGCGEGSFLCSLVHYGVEPALLEGIDLSPDKIAAARRRAPGAALFASDGAALPYRNGVFDLVFAFTFFSSVFDPGVRLRAADEALRVLRPAGLLVVYDFWINPLNSRVRSLHAAELRALFARHRVEMERATLAPPIVRALGGRLPLCRPLERIPFLRSHLLAAVTKES